jgi:hypothetical protein
MVTHVAVWMATETNVVDDPNWCLYSLGNNCQITVTTTSTKFIFLLCKKKSCFSFAFYLWLLYILFAI